MSKVVKKVFKAVKKVTKKITNFVKKHWKKIVIAAAIVFTMGAAAIAATGAGWGSAFTSIGTTFSAGASSLTGGLIGTSATSAVASGGALAGTAGVSAATTLGADVAMVNGAGSLGAVSAESTLMVESGVASGALGTGAGGAIVVPGATTTLSQTVAGSLAGGSTGGIGVGEAMMANTALQAYGGYQDGKAEEEKANARTYYGMRADGGGIANIQTPTPQSYIPGQGQQPVAIPTTAQAPLPPPQQSVAQQQPVELTAPAPYSPGIAAPTDPSDMDGLAAAKYGNNYLNGGRYA